ncbi:hypothetical protein TRFO_38284 [Tritrichomonas foetus]|uniref:Intimal thickness related receptor IRP domain-containing protein n=1 Tax=Tritrichomonas foetus TaxID=1144522 RepID=A0A1J4JBI6_9EUKA|nr:hypothetical protein TRFO_38284 [Tritrichomonas foetus]|eukprot:OHS95599.1 hypothetical protein TRFO_38284 [Tritrichomonas foetus]
MGKVHAIVLSVVAAACTAIFLLVSFVPQSTVIKTGHSSSTVSPVSTAYIRIQFDGYDSLSSLALFRIAPKFVKASVDRNSVTIKVKGKVILLDHNQIQFEEYPVDTSYTYKIAKDFDEYMDAQTFMSFSSVKFSSIIFYLDVTTVNDIILDLTVTSTSLGQDLSLAGIIMISIVTIAVAVLLLTLISRRLPPAEKDQWFIIILSGIMFLVDGPWLLCQYYAIPSFSQLFDIMPQLFHAFFIMYVFVFFSSKSRETPKILFNNKIILLCLLAMSIIIIILEFAQTSFKPLAGFAYYKTLKSNAILIALATIFIAYHLAIVSSFIYGFIISKFERDSAMIIVIFLFFALEATQIITSLIRIFVNEKLIGTSLAADIFYILEANLVCFIMLYLDTPLSLSKDNVKFLIRDDE